MIQVTVKDAVTTKVEVLDKASATLTFSGVGDTLVDDLNDAVKNCKSDLQGLKDEDWTATCDNDTYKVKYDGDTLKYYKDGNEIADIKKAVAGKTMTLTAPVRAGKANEVIKAAQAIQNKAEYANNKAVKATITLKKTNTYTISDAVIDSRYTTAKINEKAYQVYFQDNAMYVVGDVTKDPFFKNMSDEQIAKLTLQ